MSLCRSRRELAPGVFFSEIRDNRFKTNRVSVNLFTQLSKEDASANAVLPMILTQSCAAYPDLTKMGLRLNELYGAGLDGDIRKLGDAQVLNISCGSIDDSFALEGENIAEDCARLIADCLFHPLLEKGAFAEGPFTLERQNLVDTIEGEINEKRLYTIQRSLQLLYADEPAGVSRYGNVKSASALTPQKAYAAYETLLRSARVEIIFVGCSSGEAAERVFTDAFRNADRSGLLPSATKRSSPKAALREETERFDVTQSKMALGFKTSCENQSALRLMTALYGSTPTSKLFMNVREKLSLCYYCTAQFDRFKGSVLVDCGVENQNISKAREEILRQLDAVKSGDFTDDEIRNSVMSLTNSYRSLGDSPGGMEYWHLSQSYEGTDFSPEEQGEALRRVTKDEIIEAANSLTLDTVYVLTGKEGQA